MSLFWGLLFLALIQAPEENTKIITTKLVMQPDCHIPAAPPCVPFDDPRWKTEGCRIDDGACFVIGVEAEKKVQRPEIRATLTISPRCGKDGSRTALRDAALITLFDSGYNFITFEERDVRCSQKGFVDIKIMVEPSSQ